MMVLPLAAVPFIMKAVAVVWLVVAVLLILIVLVQKGKGGGLGAAFGGGAASTLLGSKTGDFLTWVTIAMVAVFLIFGVVMAKWFKPAGSELLKESPRSSVPLSGEVEPIADDDGEVELDVEEGVLPAEQPGQPAVPAAEEVNEVLVD